MTKAVKEAAEILSRLEKIAGYTIRLDVHLDDGATAQLISLKSDLKGRNRFRLIEPETWVSIPGWENVPLDKLASKRVKTVSEYWRKRKT
ncbi:MAG: hypothetical protein AAB506_02590 [Patescibacteria group bacterium]